MEGEESDTELPFNERRPEVKIGDNEYLKMF